MSLESVRAFFAEKAPEIAVIESTMSSATVTLAAEAYGVEPARIAKTLSLRIGERVVLIVAAGTSRMDNKKVKAQFGGKPKMLGLDEVAEITGHEVGGVCPFGLKTPLPVYCDVSLKAFDDRGAGGGLDPQRGAHHACAHGGIDLGRMGRCVSGAEIEHRHFEPTGRANTRLMTGSAKQSILPPEKEWIASSLRSLAQTLCVCCRQ